MRNRMIRKGRGMDVESPELVVVKSVKVQA